MGWEERQHDVVGRRWYPGGARRHTRLEEYRYDMTTTGDTMARRANAYDWGRLDEAAGSVRDRRVGHDHVIAMSRLPDSEQAIGGQAFPSQIDTT